MKSHSFTNEIVIEFTQGNICLTSKLIFLEALNNPIDYLFMNIAFNFIVRFRGFFFARNGTVVNLLFLYHAANRICNVYIVRTKL